MSEATPAATTAAPAAAPAAAEPAPNPGKWFDTFSNADLKGYAGNKGWESPERAVESYFNLEKLHGVPPERLVKLPGKDAKPEDWNPVWDRLGRPAKSEDYKLPVPEGQDPKFAAEASKWFHEVGLSPSQAAKLAEKWNAHVNGIGAQSQETYKARLTEEDGKLKTTWGAAYEQNVGKAKLAAREFGVDVGAIDALEQTWGFAKTMEFFHALGSKMGEASFETGGKAGGFNAALTPDQARDRINALRRDPDWANRYMKGGHEERAEFERLHKMAYPS